MNTFSNVYRNNNIRNIDRLTKTISLNVNPVTKIVINKLKDEDFSLSEYSIPSVSNDTNQNANNYKINIFNVEDEELEISANSPLYKNSNKNFEFLKEPKNDIKNSMYSIQKNAFPIRNNPIDNLCRTGDFSKNKNKLKHLLL